MAELLLFSRRDNCPTVSRYVAGQAESLKRVAPIARRRCSLCVDDAARHLPVDLRLYLPQRWIDDPARWDLAGIRARARQLRSKTDLALEMVRAARARYCGSTGSASMAAMARDRASCVCWTTPARFSSPMFVAHSESGQNRRGCTFPRRKPKDVRQAETEHPWTESRWKSWSLGSIRMIGSAANCKLQAARQHARPVADRCRARAGLGVGRQGSDGAVLASNRPP